MLRELKFADGYGSAALIWRNTMDGTYYAVLDADGYTVTASTLRFMANTVEKWEEMPRD